MESGERPPRATGDTGNLRPCRSGSSGTFHEAEEGEAPADRKDFLRWVWIFLKLQATEGKDSTPFLVQETFPFADTGLLHLFQCGCSGGNSAYPVEPRTDAKGRPDQAAGSFGAVPEGESGEACREGQRVPERIP